MNMSLLDAVKVAADRSVAEGKYGRQGWFTAWDVRMAIGRRVRCDELDLLVGSALVRGSEEDEFKAHTSAQVYRLSVDA